MSSSTELKILQAIVRFRADDLVARKRLKELAAAAEESGDYTEYDEVNYYYLDESSESGRALASEIESIIIAAKQKDPR